MTQEARKARILVVEDNAADIELLRRALALASLDYELTVISDGGDAMDYAMNVAKKGRYEAEHVPDLAILDLNLPKYGGVEILTEMRRNPDFDSVTITILSSSSWIREVRGVDGLRVHRFITKPSDLQEYMGIGTIVKEMLSARPPK